MKKFNKVFTVIVFAFLYLPILVLIVASFNSGTDVAAFENITFAQYKALFMDKTLIRLLLNSLLVAVLSSAIATVIGTAAAVGIHKMRPTMRRLVMSATNIPMTNPDIVTGVSLALLFAFIGNILKTESVLGFWTILIAHITFNLPYVILSVMPKLSQMDRNLIEAAQDLGCTPFKAFFKVTVFEIMPGIISGMMMAFTMSLDDFVISYFVTGTDFITLPVEIYNYTKKPVPSKIYVLFTILFVMILAVMVTMNLLQIRTENKRLGRVSARNKKEAV